MDAEPLSKAIYEKAKSLDVSEITLNFSGGSDEGYLSVDLARPDLTTPDLHYVDLFYNDCEENRAVAADWHDEHGGARKAELLRRYDEYEQLQNEIEEWAWEVYDYSGAGDGSDYGDDIVYNLTDRTVETSEWYMTRTDGDSGGGELEIADESEVADDAV